MLSDLEIIHKALTFVGGSTSPMNLREVATLIEFFALEREAEKELQTVE